MKLSISNIAWSLENDESMYAFLADHGFSGLEIAPTRLFPICHMSTSSKQARLRRTSTRVISYASALCNRSGLEKKSSSLAKKQNAPRYWTTRKKPFCLPKQSVAPSLVFGSPKNRVLPDESLRPLAVDFFTEIGNFAAEHGAVISIEPNPPIYGTNFITTTAEAFALCREVNRAGYKVNIDLGACIYNAEKIELLQESIDLVHHIHISEPMLAPIERRAIHAQLRSLNYNGWVSIEMKNPGDIATVQSAVRYIKEVLA